MRILIALSLLVAVGAGGYYMYMEINSTDSIAPELLRNLMIFGFVTGSLFGYMACKIENEFVSVLLTAIAFVTLGLSVYFWKVPVMILSFSYTAGLIVMNFIFEILKNRYRR